MATHDARRWLVIPVEVQVRELMARLLVGAVAAARGYDVLIGHDRVVRRLAAWLPRGALFDKALGMRGEKKIARYRRLGYAITALDEESTGFLSNPDYFLETRISPESLSKAERWFAISDAVRDKVAAARPGHAGRIVTTGLPRTDVWRPAFHGLYEPETAAIRSAHGPFILFNSNFGIIIHARDQAFARKQVERHQRQYEGALAYKEKMLSQLRPNLDAFLEMLPKLREWFPGHKLIVRPHPSEDRDFWRESIAGIDGAEVHDTGLAAPWILASSCLVHHGCTTGIEAELMGKPHVMYAPHPDDHHDTPLMADFAPIVHDLDRLESAIGKLLEDGDALRKDRAALEKWYAALTGRLASERIVDEFDRLDLPAGRPLGALKPLRFTPRHLVARYWPRSQRARAYSRQKWYGVELDDIRRRLAIMGEAAALDRAVVADEVFPQLFHLRAQ